MIQKYRKKPVVIEAVIWDGRNFDEVMNFMQEFHGNKVNYENAEEGAYKTGELTIRTLEGNHTASKGDFIIKGVKGEFYPCKPDIFEMTYEKAEWHMERKFKVGDRVKDKITGISCDVVYVHEDSGWPFLIVGKTASGVCVNWRRLEQIELIPPPQKLPEPKFNPYDKVRVNIKNFTPFNAEVTAWFICGDHYIYELKTEDGGTFQSKGEGVELIEPKYKKGDKVWDKKHKEILWFVKHNAEKSIPLSDIEGIKEDILKQVKEKAQDGGTGLTVNCRNGSNVIIITEYLESLGFKTEKHSPSAYLTVIW